SRHAAVTRAATPKLGAYASLVALGLLAALATRRPELVVLAAPFALSAALGLVLARRPQLDARVDLATDRALEGEEVEVRVLLEAAVGAERVEVLLELPRDLVVEAGDNPILVHLHDGARRGELWVNEHHAERNADVVILLDSFAEVRRGDRTTLDPALRAAASLAARYLRQKDRVGFVAFGGFLNWLLPSTGAGQLYRI